MSTPRRWTLWASAGLLALVVVVALTAAVTTWVVGDDEPRRATIENTSTPDADLDGSCPYDRDQQPPKVEPPVGVQWEDLAAEVPFKVPVSDRYGPCEVTDTTATGYARTPRGALLAAAQIVARAAVPGEMGEQTIEKQFLPGQWRDAMLRDLQSKDGEDFEAPEVEWTAFAISSWTKDSARISLAAQYAQDPGNYRVFEVDLGWADGDWRMHAPTGGDWLNVVTTRSTLTQGFIAWGPR